MNRFEQFIKHRQYLLNVSPNTLRWYRHAFKWLPSESPSQEQLDAVILKMRESGLKPTGCNAAARAINAYLHWSSDPSGKCGGGCHHPRIKPMREPEFVPVVFTDDQVTHLVNWRPRGVRDRRLHLLVLLLLDTGARISEVLSVRVADIDFENFLTVGYQTQKPEVLLQRIMKTSSNENDLVLDCFVGSGTTAMVAEKLNRRWIACDLSRFAVHTTRKRLLGVPGIKPFSVQNLGKYERQMWQAAEFGENSASENSLEQQRQREATYRKFILDLYRATPLTGHTWLHGTKSGRMVHVGAVDAPITLTDIKAVAREVWKSAGSGAGGRKAAADILGWEFAFELNETARQIAAESRVDVAFKKIPREVLERKAVEQGDVKFFELGALSVQSTQNKRDLSIKLTDFLIPVDDVPEEARRTIKHWSQMIDYWAVDWDFKDDTFHNQWQSYRTRQEPDIELSAKYEYEQAGTYKVVVKVIDILGNDTTKTLDIKVK